MGDARRRSSSVDEEKPLSENRVSVMQRQPSNLSGGSKKSGKDSDNESLYSMSKGFQLTLVKDDGTGSSASPGNRSGSPDRSGSPSGSNVGPEPAAAKGQSSGFFGYIKSMLGAIAEEPQVQKKKRDNSADKKATRAAIRQEHLDRIRGKANVDPAHRLGSDVDTHAAGDDNPLNDMQSRGDRSPRAGRASSKSSRNTRQTQGAGAPGGDLPLGVDAYIRNMKVQNSIHMSRYQAHSSSGQRMTPISKSYEKHKEDHRLVAHRDASVDLGPKAGSLAAWFEGGLAPKAASAGMELKRALPLGYQVAPWSGGFVPLIRHVNTGVVVWPVRFDLMPFYEAIEGATPGLARRNVTVYHYTNKQGFEIMVAPFGIEDLDEYAEFSEEVWDRIEDDIGAREKIGVQLIEVPEMSLELRSLPPDSYPDYDRICKAVYHLADDDHIPAGKVSYCFALNVPEDMLLVTYDKRFSSTVYLQAPGTREDEADGLSDYLENASTAALSSSKFVAFLKSKGKKNTSMVPVRLRERVKKLREERSRKKRNVTEPGRKMADEVRSMNLLYGIVDRVSGDVIMSSDSEGSGSPRSPHGKLMKNKLKASLQRMLKDANHHEEEEHEKELRIAKEELAQLEAERERTERKLQKASKAVQMAQRGRMASFFDSDPRRVGKLQQHLVNLGQRIDVARNVVYNMDDKVARENRRVALLEALSESTGGQANMDVAVKARRNKNQYSEFARETQDTVCDIHDEYKELEGDMLRDFLGGGIKAATSWLEQKGDPNQYHPGTGWTAVMMAVSGGNTEVVQMLADRGAKLSMQSRSSGETCIFLALYKNTTEMAHKILELNGYAVNEQRFDGSTPLIAAVEKSPPRVKDELVRALLDANADPNTTRKDGWSALAIAIAKNMRFPVRVMIAGGRGNIMSEIPVLTETGEPMTLWELSATWPGLQEIIRSKLTSKDLTAIEKRWPGALMGTRAGDDDGW
eukprot:TRINITY_DN52409_c0_g1_i1.p1 TRINITY_DN52409_c0_g1~~TRINITY_DN52409_c0_g1_i1.p1  ORF type:complete len:972 (+),score=183.55 TRINITY_DN52409_c0_g1_i1:109-3024(+)